MVLPASRRMQGDLMLFLLNRSTRIGEDDDDDDNEDDDDDEEEEEKEHDNKANVLHSYILPSLLTQMRQAACSCSAY